MHNQKTVTNQPFVKTGVMVKWNTYGWRIYLLLVLFIAAVLRLSSLSMMEFRHDSAYWALDGYRILQGDYYPLVGQQVGSVRSPLYNGPALSYITAIIFALFGYNPLFVSALIATLNVVGVYLVYLVGYRLYSRNVGLIMATLASVSPWIVLYSRMFWPQSLFPFLIPLMLLCLINALEKDRVIDYTLTGILLGLGVQLHLSALAIVGTSMLIMLIYSKAKWKVSCYTFGVALGYAPNIIYDLTSDFAHIKSIMLLPSLHAVDEPRIFHFAKTIWNFSNVLSGQGLWVSKLSKSQYLPSFIDWGQGVLYSLVFIVCLAAIFYYIASNSKSDRLRFSISYKDAIVLLFLLLPLAYLFFSRSLIQRHYFLFIYPLPLLVIARGFEILSSRIFLKKDTVKVRSIFLVVLAILCLFNVITIGYAARFLEQTGGQGEYGTVFVNKDRVVSYIVEHSSGEYIVDLRNVQESLPYVFLFQTRGKIIIDGDHMIAYTLQSYPPSHRSPKYRIVETYYHPVVVEPGERIVFQVPGIVVLVHGN